MDGPTNSRTRDSPRASATSAVHSALGVVEFVLEQQLDRVGRALNLFTECDLASAGRSLQDVVGTLLLGRWLADANAQARELVGADRLGNGLQSVVARQSPASLQLETT